MAQTSQETFCSTCLGLLKDPVTVLCGHSHCMTCIKTYRDEEDQENTHRCRQCRKRFTPRPANNICSLHDELREMFCRTDQQCICYLCSVDQHKGHDAVSAAAERTERQRELEGSRQRIRQRIQDGGRDVKLLQQEAEAIGRSADRTVEDSEKVFTELIRLMERRRSEVKQQIRSQQETEASRVKELQEKLEQEIRELKRRDAELEQLSHTEDHTQFLLHYPSLAELSGSTDSSGTSVRPLRYFEEVTAAVTELRDQLQDVLSEGQAKVSVAATRGDVLLSEPEPEPLTRAEFLKYACKITLDPNTANTRLLLSDENRKVTFMVTEQSFPDHPDRYTVSHQVLSKASLLGFCYWEERQQGSHSNTATLQVKHLETMKILGCLIFSNVVMNSDTTTPVSGPGSSRLGVFLDHRAGVLSFYSVSGTMTLLHRVQTTFTQPLYVGLRVETLQRSVSFSVTADEPPSFSDRDNLNKLMEELKLIT